MWGFVLQCFEAGAGPGFRVMALLTRSRGAVWGV